MSRLGPCHCGASRVARRPQQRDLVQEESASLSPNNSAHHADRWEAGWTTRAPTRQPCDDLAGGFHEGRPNAMASALRKAANLRNAISNRPRYVRGVAGSSSPSFPGVGPPYRLISAARRTKQTEENTFLQS